MRVTILHMAAKHNRHEIVPLLLEKSNTNINSLEVGGYSALSLAARKGHTDIVRMLLENESINVNAGIYHYPELKKTTNNAGNIFYFEPEDATNTSTLFLAIEKGHLEIVELLLAKDDIDLNFINWDCQMSPMGKAIVCGHTDIAIELLKHKEIDVNAVVQKNEDWTTVSCKT